MNISQHLLTIWYSGGYEPPRTPLIYENYDYMAVIEDNGPFVRFMNDDGVIYTALYNHCTLADPVAIIGPSIYYCDKVNPILCGPVKGPENARDAFVLDHIIPVLRTYK